MRSEWPRVTDRVSKAAGSLLQSVVTICCRGRTLERAELIEKFFEEKPKATMIQIQRSVNQTVESTRVS